MAKAKMLEATTTKRSSNVENDEVGKVLQYLAPWIEKNDDEESIGALENHFGYQDDDETVGTLVDTE